MPYLNRTETAAGLEKICIFVSSSDNTKDIFTQVFRVFPNHWKGCTIPRFVGLNSSDPEVDTHGFQPVYAPVAGWRRELLHQITALPPSYSHVLLFLDDFFLFADVDVQRLESLLALGVRGDLPYLRFRSVRRPLVTAALYWLKRRLNPEMTEEIPESHPYYSSLQVVLWNRSHLVEMLGSHGGDIWEFEMQRRGAARHHALVGAPPIRYLHLVEKGQWHSDAAALFAKAGLDFASGKRAILPAGCRLRPWIDTVKFMIFGFSFIRIRRALASLNSSAQRSPGETA